MKIIENTSDRLIIEDRPVFLWVVLFGIGFAALASLLAGRVEGTFETIVVMALGIGVIWVGWRYEPYQVYEFDRSSGMFTHRLTRVTGSETFERSLSEINRATDEGHWDEGTRSHRVTLITKDGPYPLESGFTGIDRKKVIEAINQWLGVA